MRKDVDCFIILKILYLKLETLSDNFSLVIKSRLSKRCMPFLDQWSLNFVIVHIYQKEVSTKFQQHIHLFICKLYLHYTDKSTFNFIFLLFQYFILLADIVFEKYDKISEYG